MMAKLAAFNINEGPVPKALISKPETAGPTKRAALKFAEPRLMAFLVSSLPTISGVKL